jgi:hypothetical protein
LASTADSALRCGNCGAAPLTDQLSTLAYFPSHTPTRSVFVSGRRSGCVRVSGESLDAQMAGSGMLSPREAPRPGGPSCPSSFSSPSTTSSPSSARRRAEESGSKIYTAATVAEAGPHINSATEGMVRCRRRRAAGSRSQTCGGWGAAALFATTVNLVLLGGPGVRAQSTSFGVDLDPFGAAGDYKFTATPGSGWSILFSLENVYYDEFFDCTPKQAFKVMGQDGQSLLPFAIPAQNPERYVHGSCHLLLLLLSLVVCFAVACRCHRCVQSNGCLCEAACAAASAAADEQRQPTQFGETALRASATAGANLAGTALPKRCPLWRTAFHRLLYTKTPARHH